MREATPPLTTVRAREALLSGIMVGDALGAEVSPLPVSWLLPRTGASFLSLGLCVRPRRDGRQKQLLSLVRRSLRPANLVFKVPSPSGLRAGGQASSAAPAKPTFIRPRRRGSTRERGRCARGSRRARPRSMGARPSDRARACRRFRPAGLWPTRCRACARPPHLFPFT